MLPMGILSALRPVTHHADRVSNYIQYADVWWHISAPHMQDKLYQHARKYVNMHDYYVYMQDNSVYTQETHLLRGSDFYVGKITYLRPYPTS